LATIDRKVDAAVDDVDGTDFMLKFSERTQSGLRGVVVPADAGELTCDDDALEPGRRVASDPSGDCGLLPLLLLLLLQALRLSSVLLCTPELNIADAVDLEFASISSTTLWRIHTLLVLLVLRVGANCN
jgi:hypothetical protein